MLEKVFSSNSVSDNMNGKLGKKLEHITEKTGCIRCMIFNLMHYRNYH